MYEFIHGILREKTPLRAIVEAGGIGYRLSIPLSTYTSLPACETPICLYLSQVVREDSQTLFAFLTHEDRDLFETLITLSGIGPKTALAIVGHMEVGTFQRAISASDTRLLSKIPGVGKKTAERLIVEMRDKIKGFVKKGAPLSSLSLADNLLSDAISALLNLGYAPLDAQKAVQSALEEKKEETDLGHLITLALKKI